MSKGGVSEISKSHRLRSANKAECAEFFDVAIKTIDGWVRRGCPVVRRGSAGTPWEFDLFEVCQWRINGQSTDAAEPDQMTPQDRKAWYESEGRRRELQVKDRELIPVDEVEEAIATAFGAISQGMLSLPDNVERRTGCSAEMIEAVESVVHSELNALADRLQDLAPVEVADE